ncbi:FMN-dependent dehydrogenase [Colletotrichum simmondsii]|uniref:L-lactate dehydrogenase (cytochrome) n=1 Tax=Colletotrichum simmondsii TaxID=703756 RepID=A0A135RX89_9PEZI|nr:FMN-dependent dehydrogenase [Colletotrichum simmondsii]
MGPPQPTTQCDIASEKTPPLALGWQSTPACMGGGHQPWAIARVASKGKPGEDGTLQPHHPEGPSRRNTARNRLPPSVPGHVRLRLGARPATTYKDGDARLHLSTSSLSLTPFFYPCHLYSYDKNMPPLTLTPADVSKHNRLDDLWLAIDGAVYDFTDFVREHPGGIAVILKCAGKDATEVYSEVHGPNLVKSTIPISHHKGVLPPGAIMAKPQPHKWPQQQQQQDPSQKQDSQTPPTPPTMPSKPPLTTLISAHDFESAASTSFSPKAWAFVSSAATDLFTKTRNATLYSQITLRPRVLVDVAAVSTATTMLSHTMRAPIFCPPTAMARLVHPEGEKELGRACKSAGVPQCVSVSASFPLEDILAAQREHEPATPYDVPVFFQLYVDKNRANSERLLRSAQAQGVKALFLTIDAPIPGKREADERVASDESLGSPISGARAVNDAKGGALGRIMGSYIDASVNWSDIAWLRRTVPGLPIVLKGVQTWMDAEWAVEAGVEAIVLSNHGGRSLDTSPATIMVLLELQKNCPHVFDRVEVYVDGGISRGTDIFKALCLGAKAVGVGRGLLYGLNYGAEGVERYIEILRDELETTMKMCGVTNLNQVHPGFLNTLAVDHLIPGRHDNPNTPWRRDLHSKL